MNKCISILITVILSMLYSFQIAAQDGITAAELKKHIQFLASDSLKGRKPGTTESYISAKYIAGQFKQNGLKLIGEDGFQNFEVISGIEAGDNQLKIENKSYQPGKDFTTLAYSENARVRAEVIFVGYGFDIKQDNIIWNDYENMEVKGKWVMIMRGFPKEEKNAFSEFGKDRMKILTARDKGAAGIIFVSSSGSEKPDELIPLEMGRSIDKCGLPVIQIKRGVADQLLSKSGKKIELFEKKLNENKKPLSFNTGKKAEIKTEVKDISSKTQNIVAILEGSDPNLKSEYVILGAHYDHLGYGGRGSGSLKPDTIAIHNGADDNASGVASILEIAQSLAGNKSGIKRSIVFIAFGAEEMGTLGSAWFVKNPLIDLKKTVAMLNFDMVGRLDKDSREITIFGTGTAVEWEDILNKYQQNNTLKLSYSKEGNGASDHANFYTQQIPVLHFFTGTHGDYHKPEDDENLINYQGQEEISKLAAQLAIYLASMPGRLTFKDSGSDGRKSQMGELKVKLDLMPDFSSTNNTGFKVGGVTKNGRAYKAGIQKGDIITAINGEKVLNIEDYMSRLMKLKPGERITVDVMRGEEKKVFFVDL